MERFVKRFWTADDGNTTVDWMVMTAGLVLLGAAVMASIGSGAQTAADDTPKTTVESTTTTGA